MPYTNAGKHVMLDALATDITEVSLHTAYPPSDVNELAGGSYARQTPTFTAAGTEAQGRVDHNQLTFNIPSGATVGAVAYRILSGTIVADADVPDETFNQEGQFTITDASYLDLNG